ncbi:MAG: SUMF1/EgtB/PvdO family nonheme iron enzyme [Candidatus Poribacteria bacterium]
MFSAGTKLLGKYEIQEHIGDGRFGEVYRAKDLLCNRIVAIKALRKGVYEAGAIRYVTSEFRAMGMLWGHPNVVSIHSIEPGDLIWDDEKSAFTGIKTDATGYLAYIVMEFVDGQNLYNLLENGKPPIEDALNICLDICNGLAYAHQNRIIHRDVKPKNVLIAEDGTAKVGDFSIAKLLEEGSYVGSFVGTSKYMAPEQYDGRYNHQVDIYATGLLLFESVTGHFPFNGQNRQELEMQKKRGDFVVPADIPKELAIVIIKALQPLTVERYQTAEEMREALHKVKVILYERTFDSAPISYQRQLRKKWRFSREEELIYSLRIITEDAKAKEEKLKAELDIQINDSRKMEEELRHHREAKEHLEEVVHDYIHETQMQNSKLQKLERINDNLINSLNEQEEEKTKLARTLQAARREIGRLNRRLKQFSPHTLWTHRVASAIFVLMSIVLMTIIGGLLSELDIYKIANQTYETRILVETEEQSPETKIGKDGAMMILIPAGNSVMGDNISGFTGGLIPKFSRLFKKSNEEEFTVYLDNFYIDKYEVTNSQYVKFLNSVKENKSSEGYKYVDLDNKFCPIEYSRGRYRVKSAYDEYPVTEVSWYGARDYAKWAGKRLPTETEWEKAARGGIVGKRYPWGDKIDPSKAHYGVASNSSITIKDMLKPVGSFRPNGYGLYDVVGNVWEWVEYDKKETGQNSTGLDNNSRRLLCGGGWDSSETDLRLSAREAREPDFMGNNIGFRCAQSVDDKTEGE